MTTQLAIRHAEPADALEATLSHRSTLQTRRAGESIFREGEKPAGIYVLHSGEVELLFSARTGNAKPLRAAQAGQILGLSSIVSHHPHAYSAVARTNCDVAFIGAAEFMAMLDESPLIWFSVLRLLSEDVGQSYDCIRLISVGRLAAV